MILCHKACVVHNVKVKVKETKSIWFFFLVFFAAILAAILNICTFARAAELNKWDLRNYRQYT
jgi:hypothetical protein